MLRGCELDHLNKNNYVYIGGSYDGFVCVAKELWYALLNSEENQKLIKSMKNKAE